MSGEGRWSLRSGKEPFIRRDRGETAAKGGEEFALPLPECRFIYSALLSGKCVAIVGRRRGEKYDYGKMTMILFAGAGS